MQDLEDLTVKDIKEALEDGYFCIKEKKQWKSYLTSLTKDTKKERLEPEPRECYIEKSLEIILKRYIKGRKNSEYAFFSQKGNHITAKSYSAILTKVAKELRLKNISGHSLRKVYATRLYEETKDIDYVRVALGHSSIEITKRYLGLDENIKKSAAKIAAKKL